MRKNVLPKINKEKGITLVALVVTIIVLLILAGVAISLTIRNNGLFSRAKMAIEKTKEETAKQEVKMAWDSITADYALESSIDKNIKKEDYYTKENLNKELKEIGKITEYKYSEQDVTILKYVKLNKNNIQESYEMEIEPEGTINIIKRVPISEGTIEFSELVWENKKANLRLSTVSGYKIQYKVNNTSDGGWTTGKKVVELKLDDIVYARLWDENVVGEVVNTKILDSEIPDKAKITFSNNSMDIEDEIVATVEQTDNQSGIEIESCKWEFDTNPNDIEENSENFKGTFNDEVQNITLNATTEGTYYLHVITVDDAGNKRQTTSEVGVIVKLIEIEKVLKEYTIDDIINNKDNVLKKLFEDKSGTSYMLENYLQRIVDSNVAMDVLKESTLAYEEVMSNKEYFNKILNSNKMNYLDEKAKRVPKLSSNKDKGYTLSGTEHNTYRLYNAFDSSDKTYWLTPSFGNATMYIEFPVKVKIYHIYYFLGSTYRANYTATSYQIYGISEDGKESLISSGNVGTHKKDIYFYNNTEFLKYKIFFSAGVQAAGASILDIYYR